MSIPKLSVGPTYNRSKMAEQLLSYFQILLAT